jgi:putative transposase
LWIDAKLLCWVLMPDHAHLLVQLGKNEALSKLMTRLKSNTSRSMNMEMCRSGALWQKGYHDRAIRSEDDVQAVARYVVMNPIRACLVKSVGMYPYWDAVWLLGALRG